VPLIILSGWFAPIIWLSFILLLDPLNALRGWPSITGDLARGDWRRLLSLLTSGFVCGFLWESWNYWALTKWTYTVPYLGDIKIFEMPVLGYLASRLICNRVLGDVHLCAFAAQSGRAYGRKQ